MGVALAWLAAAAALIPSSPDLGKANAPCRPGEPGPAFVVEVVGLRDRTGLLKLELYPANDRDFLADDNVLVGEGKAFRRIEGRLPPSGDISLCIRAPAPGRYALSLLHDRNANHKFNTWSDGIGFSGNPKLGWSKPASALVTASTGSGVTRLRIVLNYRHGLSFRPD